jgi:hypothetical protein
MPTGKAIENIDSAALRREPGGVRDSAISPRGVRYFAQVIFAQEEISSARSLAIRQRRCVLQVLDGAPEEVEAHAGRSPHCQATRSTPWGDERGNDTDTATNSAVLLYVVDFRC